MPSSHNKDPDAKLDYSFDWDKWLNEDEIITEYIITTEEGLTNLGDSTTGKIVTVWLESGTIGQRYSVACRITTNEGRIDERTAYIAVKER